MPGGDRTGPQGCGPMTGRGMGYCAGYAMPGAANAGFGMGRGRGFRRMYYMTGLPGWARCGAYPYGFSPYTAAGKADVDMGSPKSSKAFWGENEKEILQEQAEFLEKQLKEVRERLECLENDK